MAQEVRVINIPPSGGGVYQGIVVTQEVSDDGSDNMMACWRRSVPLTLNQEVDSRLVHPIYIVLLQTLRVCDRVRIWVIMRCTCRTPAANSTPPWLCHSGGYPRIINIIT